MTYVDIDVCHIWCTNININTRYLTNPGGNISPDQVYGRDRFIDELWNYLESQSLVMTAERRQGKTQILKKMAHEPRANWVPVYQNLSKINSTEEFANTIFEIVQSHLSKAKKTTNHIKKWLDERGIKIPGIVELLANKNSWKELITHAITDLVQEQGNKKLVFFWDEFPWMIDNIRHRENEERAMEVLALLRSLSEEANNFRMILTGSVGLHHVLQKLKEAGQVNAPLNKTYPVKLVPLLLTDAKSLASRLIMGEEISCTDIDSTSKMIAEEVDCRPYYVHHVVRRLKSIGGPADPATVQQAIRSLLVDANDPWEFRHFRDRIVKYYGLKEEALVFVILDELAISKESLPLKSLFEKIKAQQALTDQSKLRTLLQLLERDHYVTRALDGSFAFEFPLLARWWVLDRGL